MSNQNIGGNSPLSSFFDFKNEETVIAIEQVINMYEGVLPENMTQYLNYAHSRTKGKLLIDAQKTIKKFWKENGHLTLSDIKGIFNLAMDDIQYGMIKKGDDFVKQMRGLK